MKKRCSSCPRAKQGQTRFRSTMWSEARRGLTHCLQRLESLIVCFWRYLGFWWPKVGFAFFFVRFCFTATVCKGCGLSQVPHTLSSVVEGQSTLKRLARFVVFMHRARSLVHVRLLCRFGSFALFQRVPLPCFFLFFLFVVLSCCRFSVLVLAPDVPVPNVEHLLMQMRN